MGDIWENLWEDVWDDGWDGTWERSGLRTVKLRSSTRALCCAGAAPHNDKNTRKDAAMRS